MNYLAVKWHISNNDIYTKYSGQFFENKCDIILCRNYVEICKSLSSEIYKVMAGPNNPPKKRNSMRYKYIILQ